MTPRGTQFFGRGSLPRPAATPASRLCPAMSAINATNSPNRLQPTPECGALLVSLSLRTTAALQGHTISSDPATRRGSASSTTNSALTSSSPVVAQRTREIGVRTALGTFPGLWPAWCLRTRWRWTYAGAAIGVAGSLVAERAPGSHAVRHSSAQTCNSGVLDRDSRSSGRD
jgi:hypothetical protein